MHLTKKLAQKLIIPPKICLALRSLARLCFFFNLVDVLLVYARIGFQRSQLKYLPTTYQTVTPRRRFMGEWLFALLRRGAPRGESILSPGRKYIPAVCRLNVRDVLISLQLPPFFTACLPRKLQKTISFFLTVVDLIKLITRGANGFLVWSSLHVIMLIIFQIV